MILLSYITSPTLITSAGSGEKQNVSIVDSYYILMIDYENRHFYF